MYLKLFNANSHSQAPAAAYWKNVLVVAHNLQIYPTPDRVDFHLIAYSYVIPYSVPPTAREIVLDIPGADDCQYFYDNSASLLMPPAYYEKAKIVVRNTNGDYYAWAFLEKNRLVVITTDIVHDYAASDVARKLLDTIAELLGFTKRVEVGDTPNSTTNLLDLRLGLDPEFEVYTSGRVISARNITLPRDQRIGRDGSGNQVELRPQPSEDPDRLYDSILELVQKSENAIGCNLLISGNTYPLGCHIHFGPGNTSQRAWWAYVDYTHIVDLLRGAVGDLAYLSGTARGGYLDPRAYEGNKRHGGFEYRALPSCILVTRKVFTFVIQHIIAVLNDEQRTPLQPHHFPRLEYLVRARFHFTFQYKIATKTIYLPDSTSWPKRWNEVASQIPTAPYSLVPFRAERGLATNNQYLAKLYGWEHQSYGNINQICVPYQFRMEASEDDIAQFLTILTRLHTYLPEIQYP